MHICDDAFLMGLTFNTEVERCQLVARLLEKSRVPGHVKVLVLSDLHLENGINESFSARLANAKEWLNVLSPVSDWDAIVIAGDLVAAHKIGWDVQDAASLSSCYERFEAILEQAGTEIDKAAPDYNALIVPGNHDVVRKCGTSLRRRNIQDVLDKRKHHQSSAFNVHVQSRFAKAGAPTDSPGSAGAPRLLLFGYEHGVVAMIGLDSNQMAYNAPGLEDLGLIGPPQLDKVKELIRKLKSAFADRPLFLWTTWHHHLLPVYNTEQLKDLMGTLKKRDPRPEEMLSVFDAITVDGRSVIEELCENDVSLATHGHMHAPCIQRVSYTALADQSLNIVACPSCRPKPDLRHPYVGAAMLGIDLDRGFVDVFIKGQETHSPSPLGGSVGDFERRWGIPMRSASRVPLGEIRLYRHLNMWLDRGVFPVGRLGAFAPDVPRPIDGRKGDSPWERSIVGCLSRTGYVPVCMGTPEEVVRDMLLTKEDIETLPRKRYRLLLLLGANPAADYDVLLSNFFPLRISDYGSWDTPLLPAFKTVRGLVQGWLMDVRRRLDDFRAKRLGGESVSDEIKGLEKILNEMNDADEDEGKLITVGTKQFVKFSPTDGVPQIYDVALTVWPQLSAPSSPLYRFLAHSVERINSDILVNKDFRKFPRGLVWVPLSRWRDSEAIKARNADVMAWVDETLGKLKEKADSFPEWLVAGSGKPEKVRIRSARVIAFGNGAEDRGGASIGVNLVPESLVEGLDRVETRNGCFIYQGKEIRRGILRAEERGHRRGIAVSVLDVNDVEKKVGYLRPVQRYVLKQGLERAAEVRDKVNAKLDTGMDMEGLGRSNANGYVRVEYAGGGVISVLPLLIERIAVADQENVGDGFLEFVLCDGNHRLVQYLLIEKRDSVGCVVVMGEPKQPYYGWPCPRWDWNVVLQNRLNATPERFSKYTPRYPDDAKPEEIERNPEMYRHVFRNLTTGFGDIGDQGGRFT